MSVAKVGVDKWLLVEWGNGARGVVHSRYMVCRDNLVLRAGCTITISKRGEQQLATFIARSNDRQLLEQIIGDEAGPSVPPEPEVEDFSPSASSWEPSDDDDSESDYETRKPKMDITPKRYPKYEKRTKKVLKPTNKVKAVIPNPTYKAHNMNIKTYRNPRKRSHGSTKEANKIVETPKSNKNIDGTVNVKEQSRLVTVTLDINLIFGMLGALNKLGTGLGLIDNDEAPTNKERDNAIPTKNELEYKDNVMVLDTFDELGCYSEDSNRSDDNVLITNKYQNIENNEEELEYVINEQQKNSKNISLNVSNTNKSQTEKSTTYTQEQAGVIKAPEEDVVNDTQEESNVNNTQRQQPKILNDIQQNNILNNDNNIKLLSPVNNIQEQEKENDTKQHKIPNVAQKEKDNREWVPIGSGKTLVHKDKFRKVKWSSYTIATRTLLLALFPRRTLATHSLTGKKSPAFQDKPAKMCLDPKKITDIIIEVMDRFDVKENLVRSIITTKCADESKMFRTRMEKKKTALAKQEQIEKPDDSNKENN